MTSELEQRPNKRARSSSAPASAKSSLQHDERFWFNDGNIILACGDIGFRVHAGVLSLNCRIFRDMLASGTPSAGEVHEDVDLVRLSDEPADVRLFLTPMYFADEGPMRTQYRVAQLKTLLDMARKYMADRLQKTIMQHLRELFPSEHERARAPYSPLRPSRTYGKEGFDPWVAVEISLEHDVPIILPMALYYSALRMDLEGILDLNISAAALRKILSFRESFITQVNNNSTTGDGYFDVYSCENHQSSCDGVSLPIQEVAIRYYRGFEDDVFTETYAEANPDGCSDALCPHCLKKFTDMQKDFSEYLWEVLPYMCKGSPTTWPAVRNMQTKADGASEPELP
ncbi:hypothetical protein PENSPDRAFT_733528 [Peniophora sp. CONT]|nr:hypothetical protein PENSPDRAFT_733528 [Peniophora sp. CONT]